MKKINYVIAFFILTISFNPNIVIAQNSLTLEGTADIASRYVWRGLLINDSPNIQPSLSVSYSGLSFGFWGSYSLDRISKVENDYSVSQELDTWVQYSIQLGNTINISTILTDYYFPKNGIKIGNFNNYDNPEGAGAHTMELGVSLSGNNSFPLNFAGYVNIYNDEGNNTYFQIDYLTNISNYNIDLFIGAAGGSKDNSGYYGTEKFNVLNLGITAKREIKISDSFSLPVYVSYILNPKVEISYLIFGLSF